MPQLLKYGQYKSDIFTKLAFPFVSGRNILDVGCGDCTDAEIFIKEFDLETYGVDMYANATRAPGLKFQLGSILELPFQNAEFDYVFMHDVLHHVDEVGQNPKKHRKALGEVKRVLKRNGTAIVIEGNRYNPLFYPHVVKFLGHDHWRQGYFERKVREVFPEAIFKNFEAHLYPWALRFWKAYEQAMEMFCPRQILAYNVAVMTTGG